MKILVVNTVPYKGNGVTNVIYQYYKEMQCDDFQFDFAGINAPSFAIEENNGERFFVLSFRNRNPIKYVIELTKICIKGRYDVVHAHGNSGTLVLEAFAAKLAKIPIRIAHGHSVSTRNKFIHFLLRPLLLWCATTYVACSKEAGEFLFGSSPFFIVKNAFDVNSFSFSLEKREELRERFGIESSTIVFGNVSTLSKTKNHKFLIDVFSEYKKHNKNAVLMLVGKGPYESEIREYINNSCVSDAVMLLGERSDVADLLNVFDYFVFPSLYEGLGISLLEAQANGLPVFATARTIPEIVKVNKNFWFLELKQPKEWSSQILATNTMRNPCGLENVKMSGYSIEENAEVLKALYKKENTI